MKAQTKPVWRKSMVNLAVRGLLGLSVLPWMATAQQDTRPPRSSPPPTDTVPSAGPGVPITPTSSIVNNTKMRPTSVAAVSLFNGTSLTGWTTSGTAWAVQDSAITGGTGVNLATDQYLATSSNYKNFELTLKVKVPPQGDLNNGGIEFLRTSLSGGRSVAYQFDAGSGYWGTLFDDGTRARKVRSAPVSPPKDGTDPELTAYTPWANAVLRLNDWNDVRLLVEYPRIRGWVNGVIAIDFTETESAIANAVKAAIRTGTGSPIRLQAQSGSAVKVQYKDINITQLADDELLPLGDPNFAKIGRWLPPKNIGLMAINAHILPNGKVLMHDATIDHNVKVNNGTWKDISGGTPRPSLVALYDPDNDSLQNMDQWFITQRELDLFCSGHAFLPNGNLIFQGNFQYSTAASTRKASPLYNWKTNTWSRGTDSTRAAYYPTLVSTLSGDVMSFASGPIDGDRLEYGYTRPLKDHTEVYNYQTGNWRTLTNDAEWAALGPKFGGNSLVHDPSPYYTVAMMPGTGKILHLGPPAHLVAADYAGSGGAQYYNTREGIVRNQGTAQIYDIGKVLYAGGGAYATRYGATSGNDIVWTGTRTQPNSAVIVDMNSGWTRSPTATLTGEMQEGRINTFSSLMADGKVMITGGHDGTASYSWKDTAVEAGSSWSIAKLRPEVWDPATGVWSEMQPQQRRRQYHSTAVLLPDGRILSGGSGFPNGSSYLVWNDNTIEIFEPPYLFDANGNYAVRPAFAWTPASIGYQQDFSVSLASSESIQKLHLIKLASNTHGMEMSGRLVPLSFTQRGNILTATGVDDSTVAPAGHYMLIAVNASGVPSIGKIIKVDGYLSVKIVSKPTGKALAQKDTALVPGAAIGTATVAANTTAQEWQMNYGKWTNGAYRLISRNTGMALDYSDQTSFQGFPVLNQRKPTPDSVAVAKQSFKLTGLGTGDWKLETESRTLDGYWQSGLHGRTTKDEIVSYPYDGRDNQRWYIYPTAAPATIRLATSGGALSQLLGPLVAEGDTTPSTSWYIRPAASGQGRVNIAFDPAGVAVLGINVFNIFPETMFGNPFTGPPVAGQPFAGQPGDGRAPWARTPFSGMLLAHNVSAAEWEIVYLPKGLVKIKHVATGRVLSAFANGTLGVASTNVLNDTDPYQYWRITN